MHWQRLIVGALAFVCVACGATSPTSPEPPTAISEDGPDSDPPTVDPPTVDPPTADPPNVDPPSVDPPSADPPSTETPRGPTRSGVVRDDRGLPIAGATVWAMPPGTRVLSDADGKFVVPSTEGMIWIYASKAGYEPDAQQTLDSTRDLTLHDIVRIRVGESIRVTVRPSDENLWVIDSSLREFDYRIRVVRLVADTSSKVELRLVADDGGPSEFWVRNGCCALSPGVLNMSAGTEVEIEIRISGWSSSVTRTFTLFTSAVP